MQGSSRVRAAGRVLGKGEPAWWDVGARCARREGASGKNNGESLIPS